MQYYSKALYENLSDEEWIEKLLTIPPIQAIHHYFFKIKCMPFLQYIAKNILNIDCTDSILGEFYEFLSNDNWYVLRKFNKKNNASLATYISRCTVHHFLKQKRKSEKNININIDHADIVNQLNDFVIEEEENNPPVWQAFAKLKERDRKLLRHLVIEGRAATDIADEMWKYVRSNEKDWRKLPIKRVQDTISMMKRRALFSLLEELRMQIA